MKSMDAGTLQGAAEQGSDPVIVAEKNVSLKRNQRSSRIGPFVEW
jgi:hypothetical protein